MEENIVKEGDYIIIQRHNFIKLHQVSGRGWLMLGKDKVDLSVVVGKPFWTMYKMIPTKHNKREFRLEVSERVESVLDSVARDSPFGQDNRNIMGDNKSQLLSTEDICELRDSGLSSTGIVTALIENSLSFKNKTEYSQEKYLKKKEKKYHEFVMVRKPTLRILAEVMFHRDQFKILGLRYDSLSQMMSAINIQPNSNYLLYEKGTQGLVGAAMLNYMNESSTLINLTPGIHPQKQAILAMNFPPNKLKSYLSVKILSVLEKLQDDQKPDPVTNSENNLLNAVEEKENSIPSSVVDSTAMTECDDTVKPSIESSSNVETKKRKLDSEIINDDSRKKCKWMDELARAVNILKNNRVDGLIIATKEYPLEILDNFLEFVKPSRPLVIFSTFREPLVELYVELKKRKNVLNLHMTETWLRNYQVLPDRTHPHVNMSPASGFLLTATIVAF